MKLNTVVCLSLFTSPSPLSSTLLNSTPPPQVHPKSPASFHSPILPLALYLKSLQRSSLAMQALPWSMAKVKVNKKLKK